MMVKDSGVIRADKTCFRGHGIVFVFTWCGVNLYTLLSAVGSNDYYVYITIQSPDTVISIINSSGDVLMYSSEWLYGRYRNIALDYVDSLPNDYYVDVNGERIHPFQDTVG